MNNTLLQWIGDETVLQQFVAGLSTFTLLIIIVVCIAMIRLVGQATNTQFDNVQQVLNSTAP